MAPVCPPDHRAHQEIRDEQRRLAACPDTAFVRGAGVAAGWVLRGGPGPLTGHVAALPISDRDVASELAAADLVLVGSIGTAHAYAAGVGDGLRWAAGLAVEPPSWQGRGGRVVTGSRRAGR
jgi:hypothetical protein